MNANERKYLIADAWGEGVVSVERKDVFWENEATRTGGRQAAGQAFYGASGNSCVCGDEFVSD